MNRLLHLVLVYPETVRRVLCSAACRFRVLDMGYDAPRQSMCSPQGLLYGKKPKCCISKYILNADPYFRRLWA
jgi:hypothetical protein